MFETEKRTFDLVTAEQLMGIKKSAKKYRGHVLKVRTQVQYFIVQVRFRDQFPNSFAIHDVKSFDEAVVDLKLERFTGIESLVFSS